MTSDSKQILAEVEKFLLDALHNNDYLQMEDLTPSMVAQQISDDLSTKRFIWLGNETYVPNKMICYLPGNDPDRMEELEVLFNSLHFKKLISRYIIHRGFKMFNPLAIEIRSAEAEGMMLDKFMVEFTWPTSQESAEDVTVKIDEHQGKIVEVYSLKPEIPRLARLSVMSGEVYRDNYLITKSVTHIGRLRNVIDKDANKMIRRNDFIFSRNRDESSPNSSVSRQHATIMYQNGRFYIYDSGSANGTSVERAGSEPLEVLPDNPQGVLLDNFDIIRFGTALVRFEDEAEIDAIIDRDVVQPHLVDKESSEIKTTTKLSRDMIDAEIRKLLDSE